VISVAGEVHGNLVAGEQILIRKTATMLGNLTAPRVGLEDGCSFRGSVEMESVPEKARAAAPRNTGVIAPVKPPASTAAAPAATTSATLSPGSPGAGGGPAKPETPPTRP